MNFPTKRDWREDSRIEDIELGLKFLANNYQNLGIQSLAMPPLGCGNGGLKWEDVRPLIEKYLGPCDDLDVYVYEPAAAVFSQNHVSDDQDASKDKTESIAAQPL